MDEDIGGEESTVNSRRNPRNGGSQNLKQRKKILIVEFPVGSGIFGGCGDLPNHYISELLFPP